MSLKRILPALLSGVLLCFCASAQQAPDKKDTTQKVTASADTIKKKKEPSKLKPYKEVITDKAITQNGLFKVHKLEDRYFFEVPDSLLSREFLFVTRCSKGAYNGPFTHYAGDYVQESIMQFSKGPNDKMFLKFRVFVVRTGDTSENGMSHSLENSNLVPVFVAFDIKAFSPDSSGVVFDVTDYFNSDNEQLFITGFLKTTWGYAVSSYLNDKSYIEDMKSFPENVEVRTVKTFVKGGGASPGVVPPGNVTYEFNNSIVLLPKDPMQSRFWDYRIGYFPSGYYNYDAGKPVNIEWMIDRWRLEPKEEDIEKYKRGELVEPKKPIVFYIDPATPKKWVPYLIQGVNDWQHAFEKAGFKNAIYALEAPANDSSWSIEDARHNVIVYKASRIQNASGPHVRDPRSGEIIETHVDWYHNMQQLLRDWYFVQASPNDSAARKIEFDDDLMGRLIRYVCTHEVGHTIGLLHNFVSSATIPVDSMRSKKYVQANGYCPSIMDYARFNYVAQPEDGLSREELMPRIGVYDEWAIEWGYKWVPDIKTKEEQREYFSKWITERTSKDKRLVFGMQTLPWGNLDPSRQSEDIGDDAAKAGRYGIANLKRIVPQLQEWTKQPNEDYESLRKMNLQVVQQYVRYIGHALTNIGGAIQQERNVDEKGAGVVFPSRTIQKSVIQFLQDELFTRPSWLMDSKIYHLATDETFTGRLDNLAIFHNLNDEVLKQIVSQQTYFKLMVAQDLQPAGNAYTMQELLADMDKGIWKELRTKAPIDMYRRDIQKLYVQRLTDQLDFAKLNASSKDVYLFVNINNDIYPLLKKHLRSLMTMLDGAISGYNDNTTKFHLIELRDQIKKILNSREDSFVALVKAAEKKAKQRGKLNLLGFQNNPPSLNSYLFLQGTAGCWEDHVDLGLSPEEKNESGD